MLSKVVYFPLIWKNAKTVPIAKPNKPADSPSTYRPISLLSSISKLLEKIVKEKLTNFIDDNEILPTQQFGFRNEHNTSQPLLKIRNFVKKNFNDGKSTGMILLDIKSAFDSVWHNGLIFKLTQFNFPIEIVKIIQSFLSNRSFSVYLGSTSSQFINISAGCPQGSCLSPILYNIYTADIPSIPNCMTSIFADDTSLFTADVLSTDIIFNLENALSILISYFNKWKILVNPDKTQAIYFSRKRKPCFLPQRPLQFLNNNIVWDNNVKYLGVLLDKKLNFNEHISYIINKIHKITNILYPLINRNSKLNIENKKLIIKVIFHPIMFYCASVWSTTANVHVKKLQVTQNKLLKMLYKLPWHFSTQRLHSLSGFDPVIVKINKITTNFNRKCELSRHNHINELISA